MNSSYEVLSFLEAEDIEIFLDEKPIDKTQLPKFAKTDTVKDEIKTIIPAKVENKIPATNISNITNLNSLKEAISNFNHPLKNTALNMVFAKGNPNSPDVMFIGEAPGADEDIKGIPFVGKAGQLLDKMLAAINLTEEDYYVSNVVNYRPENNRTPDENEIKAFLPFLEKHIELVNPQIICILGAVSLKALFPNSAGITKAHGEWMNFKGIPTIAIYHPAYLLRFPTKKRDSWEDLQKLQSKIQEL